ncbi:catalase-like domain-containing protein [Podospora didyma]|uniref:Catalase-like domain-containing protein n=1 Tax=Podospora didyma TaxID=330526 RepID=A0AAE0N3U8_9PEZI|nr:catalase-like domain-containing protein [Podospora didyma]
MVLTPNFLGVADTALDDQMDPIAGVALLVYTLSGFDGGYIESHVQEGQGGSQGAAHVFARHDDQLGPAVGDDRAIPDDVHLLLGWNGPMHTRAEVAMWQISGITSPPSACFLLDPYYPAPKRVPLDSADYPFEMGRDEPLPLQPARQDHQQVPPQSPKANFLSTIGEKTPVFVRFSTVTFGREFPDEGRNPRGFAIKFYTMEGNYDIVGLNFLVFFYRDPIQGPDVIWSQSRNPKNFLLDYDALFGLLANTPEANHASLIFFSDYKAVAMCGRDPDYSKRDLWDAI